MPTTYHFIDITAMDKEKARKHAELYLSQIKGAKLIGAGAEIEPSDGGAKPVYRFEFTLQEWAQVWAGSFVVAIDNHKRGRI